MLGLRRNWGHFRSPSLRSPHWTACSLSTTPGILSLPSCRTGSRFWRKPWPFSTWFCRPRELRRSTYWRDHEERNRCLASGEWNASLVCKNAELRAFKSSGKHSSRIFLLSHSTAKRIFCQPLSSQLCHQSFVTLGRKNCVERHEVCAHIFVTLMRSHYAGNILYWTQPGSGTTSKANKNKTFFLLFHLSFFLFLLSFFLFTGGLRNGVPCSAKRSGQ